MRPPKKKQSKFKMEYEDIGVDEYNAPGDFILETH